MDQIERFNHLQDLKPFMLNKITSVYEKCLKPFNYVQIKLLLLGILKTI